MNLKITHTTRYEYDLPLLGECFMEARLQPLSVSGEQICHAFSLKTDPAAVIFDYQQPREMGTVHHFILRKQAGRDIILHAESVVETQRVLAFDGLNLLAEDWQDLSNPVLRRDYAEWISPSLLAPLTPQWSGPASMPSVFAYGQALAGAIYREFHYVPGATDVSTPLDQFVAQKRGVCQDYAHLMCACARARGVPARYVSGYIYGGGDPATHGAGATHAWAELFIPHIGEWRGFDPTNNIVAADRHIKIGVGRDYADVPPTKGLLRGAPGAGAPHEILLDVHVQIEPTDLPD